MGTPKCPQDFRHFINIMMVTRTTHTHTFFATSIGLLVLKTINI